MSKAFCTAEGKIPAPFAVSEAIRCDVNGQDHRALAMISGAHKWPSTETVWTAYAGIAAVLELHGKADQADSYYRDCAILAHDSGVTQELYDAVVAACRNAAAREEKP